ncbi:CoA ester lyase [Diaminobutyricibacter tongyongensis]|uniref:CoA ester lyase n=1 Tax=Leifsonia tongyongensis TaxID=1268043 RepID=A0A6L9XV96_9MICO|nr:CoA ester lyase [Diaminobutyricibacter tongyongensis]
MTEALRAARSFLFVPGDRPERVGRALTSEADAVIIDLEDAVRADRKQAARSVVRTLRTGPGGRPPLVLVRVNAFGSPEFADDVAASLEGGAAALMIPKFVPGRQADQVDEALSAIEQAHGESTAPVVGLIESAAGVLGLSSQVTLPARFSRLAFGAADYYADLRLSYQPSGTHTELAMTTLVVASAAQGLAAPLASPHFALDDAAGLVAASRHARDLGFGGALCIHPAQLHTVNEQFGPHEAQRLWAQHVADAWDDPANRGRGAIRVDDQLVDEAIVRRARQILRELEIAEANEEGQA